MPLSPMGTSAWGPGYQREVGNLISVRTATVWLSSSFGRRFRPTAFGRVPPRNPRPCPTWPFASAWGICSRQASRRSALSTSSNDRIWPQYRRRNLRGCHSPVLVVSRRPVHWPKAEPRQRVAPRTRWLARGLGSSRCGCGPGTLWNGRRAGMDALPNRPLRHRMI